MFNSEDAAQAADVRRLPSPDRHLTVTPLDLRQPKFRSTMRGFDRAEVSAFLIEAADGYEQSLRENERLRQDLVRLETSLQQHRDLEGTLKDTLTTAQKVADDMRENATREAARIVRQAQDQAALVLQKAQARHEDVQREIDTLRLKRREAEASLESIVAALHNTIDFVREQDRRDSSPRTQRITLEVAS
jgi:cell division initiation protein